MKKMLFAIAFIVSLNASSQTVPVSLDFNITTTDTTINFNKAKIQIGQPYMVNGVSLVKIFVQQWTQVSPGDVITRSRSIIAPAAVTSVLSLNTLTMQVEVNKPMLNTILAANNINIIVQ